MLEHNVATFLGQAVVDFDRAERKKHQDALSADLETQIDAIEGCDTRLTQFYRQKAESAVESADYFLRQRRRLLDSGFIDSHNADWHLCHQRLDALLGLFESLAKRSKGYLFLYQDQYPLVSLWLLLNSKSHQVAELAPLIEVLYAQVGQQLWRQEVTLSHSPHVDEQLILCCFSVNSQLAQHALKALIERRSLDPLTSHALARHPELSSELCARIHSHRAIHLDKKSHSWLEASTLSGVDWYLQLFRNSNPVSWWGSMRQQLATQIPSWLHKTIDLIFSERDQIDWEEESAPIQFALSGNPQALPQVIDQLYQDIDDTEYELWLSSLAFVFGDKLPFSIANYGLTLDRVAIVTLLTGWWQSEKWPKRVRNGERLTYESTLAVLSNHQVCAQLRRLAWYDLCIASRTYIQYSCFESPDIQRSVLRKIAKSDEAKTRFELRRGNAVVAN
ncbi:hypothetical protein [Vibrio sp. WXL210]|uniref:hypothetical protein n=1 Tax=Vibrio sp. WXL210 TaxID=3450709 RepID=UPI003EC8941A